MHICIYLRSQRRVGVINSPRTSHGFSDWFGHRVTGNLVGVKCHGITDYELPSMNAIKIGLMLGSRNGMTVLCKQDKNMDYVLIAVGCMNYPAECNANGQTAILHGKDRKWIMKNKTCLNIFCYGKNPF